MSSKKPIDKILDIIKSNDKLLVDKNKTISKCVFNSGGK